MNILSIFDSIDRENRKHLLDLVEPNPDAVILDIGCYDGLFTQAIGQQAHSDKLFGFDIVDKGDECRSNGVILTIGNIDKGLPFDSDSFDIVVSNQVFEHLCNTDLFLKEIHRVLKPSGYALISTPNLSSWHNIIFLILGYQPLQVMLSDQFVELGSPISTQFGKEFVPEFPEHRRVPTLRGLCNLLRLHGFAVVEAHGVGYYPLPLALARLAVQIDKHHAVYTAVKAKRR